jgi:hypothetical protein
MIWGLGGVGYFVMAAGASRLLTGHFAYQCSRRQRPTGADWFWFGVLGTLAATACPVALLWHFLPPIGAEREAIQRRKADRLRELEREAGIS